MLRLTTGSSVLIQQFALGNFAFVTQFNYNGKLVLRSLPQYRTLLEIRIFLGRNDYADFQF